MKRLTLVMLIDAFGFDLLETHAFLPELTARRPLRTVAGFSSAAIPTLLTGRWPDEHGRWFLYRRAPEETPFGFARFLAPAEGLPFAGRRVRQLYEEIFDIYSGITEYYHLYDIPMRLLPYFDLPGRASIYEPNAIPGSPNLFDRLVHHGIPYSCWYWNTPEEENFLALTAAIRRGAPPFLFFYAHVLDGVMHATGTASRETEAVVRRYEESIREAVAEARRHFDEITLYVCSDHGMVDATRTIDLMTEIRRLPFREGRDYLPFYDSTFARFWFYRAEAGEAIRSVLERTEGGTLLSGDEEKDLHVHFPTREYGEAIFIAKAGTIIAPSFMGAGAPRAMHGYHPDDAGSNGLLLSNREIPSDINHIRDMAGLFETAAVRSLNGERHGASS